MAVRAITECQTASTNWMQTWFDAAMKQFCAAGLHSPVDVSIHEGELWHEIAVSKRCTRCGKAWIETVSQWDQ